MKVHCECLCKQQHSFLDLSIDHSLEEVLLHKKSLPRYINAFFNLASFNLLLCQHFHDLRALKINWHYAECTDHAEIGFTLPLCEDFMDFYGLGESRYCVKSLLVISVHLSYKSQALHVLQSVGLFQFIKDGYLLFNAFYCTFNIIVALVSNCKLIVEVSNIFTDLCFQDLLFHLNGLQHHPLSTSVFLFLSESDCHSLHRVQLSIVAAGNCLFRGVGNQTSCSRFNR